MRARTVLSRFSCGALDAGQVATYLELNDCYILYKAGMLIHVLEHLHHFKASEVVLKNLRDAWPKQRGQSHPAVTKCPFIRCVARWMRRLTRTADDTGNRKRRQRRTENGGRRRMRRLQMTLNWPAQHEQQDLLSKRIF